VTIGIWDTAGTERYESMGKLYYRSAAAACVCFDLTSLESWQKVSYWVGEIMNNEPDCKIFIIGTKYDLLSEYPRCVSQEEIQEYVESIGASLYIETSSKTGYNVDELFQQIAEKCLTGTPNSKFKPGGEDKYNNNQKQGGCC